MSLMAYKDIAECTTGLDIVLEDQAVFDVLSLV